MALCVSGAYPSPISFVGRCIAFVGKLGVRPSEFLAGVLSILSIVESCVSVKIPRWVAWYLDLRSCSITRVLYGGLRLRLASVLAMVLTSLVICAKCSLKFRTVLMWTPSIL